MKQRIEDTIYSKGIPIQGVPPNYNFDKRQSFGHGDYLRKYFMYYMVSRISETLNNQSYKFNFTTQIK